MSVYIVSEAHITVLVSAANRVTSGRGRSPLYYWTEKDGSYKYPGMSADELGRLLWAENLESVKARYPKDQDGHRPGPRGFRDHQVTTYCFHPPLNPPTTVESLKALDNYEYQSCEHDGWESSEAKEFCHALRLRLITELPGYEEAPWNWYW